ncbi:MAG: DUF4062 domain-containing protein [Acholeplasmataceae bacterium]|nr:DUF4062 domain-containing protein [Acholeplasmataceae bacterium]
MIPNVFVSSTIDDLHHLRDAVRDTIQEDLAYNPVMSEYGDVGYLPHISVQDSCYVSLRKCQIVIVFLGKRYGSVSPNGFSVTHNEFREARASGIPTIAFVDQEVLTFKKVFDSQKSDTIPPVFPGMEAPEKTFRFIQEIIDAGTNNAIIAFGKVSEARGHLKRQLASMFGELLSSRYDPIKAEIKDILSEVITLRHELSKNQAVDYRLLTATRFLLDDKHKYYRDFIEYTVGPIETAVEQLLKAKTFEEFARLARTEIKVVPDDNNQGIQLRDLMEGGDMIFAHSGMGMPSAPGERSSTTYYICFRGNRAMLNRAALEKLSWHHEQLRLKVGSRPEPN